MGKCLKTQLKEVVNNDNLKYIDSFVITIKEDTETPNYNKRNFTVILNDYKNYKAIAKGTNLYFTNSSGSTNYGTEVILSERHDLYVSNGNGIIIIQGKYDLSSLIVPYATDFINVDITDLDYIDNFNLSIRRSGYGNLPMNTTFEELYLENSNVVGSLDELDYSKLYRINVAYTSISGNLHISPILTYLRISNTMIAFNTSSIKNSNVTIINAISCINVTGSISDCANGKLTELEIRDSSVTGSLESYVEAEWDNNRRTSGISLIIGNKTSFHEEYSSSLSLYVKFDSNEATVRTSASSGTVLATYNGSSWAYN